MMDPSLSQSSLRAAHRLLLAWYRRHGRARLPWRASRDPYKVLVSEIMLAQTQVERVLKNFDPFLRQFPTLRSLAEASTADVLRAWRGLGYNSRALRLKALARQVIEQHGGVVPHDPAALRRLPGIGSYTVAAIRAFAYDQDDAALDTNVRRIVHRVFWGIDIPARVSVNQLEQQAARFVPPGRGHDWNSALMDLGSSVCTARAPKCLLCPLMSVCVAAPIDASQLEAARRRLSAKVPPRQRVAFKDTARFMRGRIIDRLRELAAGEKVSLLDLQSELSSDSETPYHKVESIVQALQKDGLLTREVDGVALAD